MDIQKNRIRNIVGGIYDIQKLRIATGNRIVASLRPGLVEDVKEGEEEELALLSRRYQNSEKIARGISEAMRTPSTSLLFFLSTDASPIISFPSLRGVEALKRPSPLTIRSTSRAALTMIW